MPKIISKTIQVHIAKFDDSINDYLYLCLKRKPDDKRYPSIWQVVTGTIDNEETSLETAKREFAEETSLSYNKFYSLPFITSFFDHKIDSIHLAPVFAAVVSHNSEVVLSEEHIEYCWLEYEKCVSILNLPSHKEGTKIFRDYILNNTLADSYLVK